MKSTIFTHKLLKEKGNDAYTYVSIHVYTYTQINEHYFIAKHFFSPPFWLIKSFLQKRNKFIKLKKKEKKKEKGFLKVNNTMFTHGQSKRKKITMHICVFICMHRRMGTICFLSKSQNFFTLPLAQKWFLQKKKKKKKTREHSSYG